jgi:lipopolysaccharide/colanic/teichoic acid biosynthesis glycosyltransferase
MTVADSVFGSPLTSAVAPAHPAALEYAAPAVAATTATVPPGPSRTIWGLDPVQLHTRYWASHGVQVVRQGEPSEIVKHAELFLLTESDALPLFRLGPLMEALNWIKPQVLFVRLHDARERGYREHVVTDPDTGKFVRFQRVYETTRRLTRVVLTPDRDVAQLWQSAPTPLAGWRRLRRIARRTDSATQSIDGNVYDRNDGRDVGHFVHDLLQAWKWPDSTVLRARKAPGTAGATSAVWVDPGATVDPAAKFIGPVWVGSGREIKAGTTVVGPAIVWDDPGRRPATEAIQWLQIEPADPPDEPAVKDSTFLDRAFKMAFDYAAAFVGLLLTLPLYPFIMLAIWIEDGRPFFFGHRRETLGGHEFSCLKFRSMRKDAEKVKAELRKLNQADGPQFYIENDPRLTRVGKFLRKYNLDELPQLFNVLAGHMSIVGPRPSPHSENQFCPAWREARLSVRPGITGLWQIKRTRRRGSDFQEWIKYDIEYVEKRTWWLDLVIIWKTFAMIVFKVSRS